jgi:hypothetical protein
MGEIFGASSWSQIMNFLTMFGRAILIRSRNTHCRLSYVCRRKIQCIVFSVTDPDPGYGAFLPPDGAMVGSGSGIRDKQTKFVNSLYTKIGRIRNPVLFYPPDPGSESGSGIRDPG